MGLDHYRSAFTPMLLGVVAAMVLTSFLRETGPAVRTITPSEGGV